MVQFLELTSHSDRLKARPICDNSARQAHLLLDSLFVLVLSFSLVSHLDAFVEGRTDILPDPVDLVRKAVANFAARQAAQRDYTYFEQDRTTTSEKTISNLYEIILLEGRPYRRHIEFNGKPLPVEEEDKEQARLKAAARKHLDDLITGLPALPAEVNSRADAETIAVADFKRHLEGLRLPLDALPDQFQLHFQGHELVNGRSCYVIEAKPKRRNQIPPQANPDAANFRLRIWIDESDLQIVRAQGKAIREGLLSVPDYFRFRVGADRQHPDLASRVDLSYGRGTTVIQEWAKISSEVWLPAEVHIKGSEFVSSTVLRTIEHDVVFTRYEKFRVGVRILSPQ